MSDGSFQRLQQFLVELKRRKVYRVAAGYLVAAFVVLQLAGLAADAFGFPGWFEPMVWVLAGLGFPLSLVLAWAFEMTAEGMRRTPEADGEATAGWSLQWIGLALVVALTGGVWYATAGDGASPSAETTAAADSAMEGQRTGPRLGKRSIAVLPFDNLSGTEEAQPFVNGIHDDLLTRLSNISDLKVISRTSVLPYRETDLSVRAIADSLGVRWVVEGGVQQAGDRVQVNAQLINAQSDVHEWAKNYRRKLTTDNLFAIQSELTKKIARSLETQLTAGEAERVERQPTGDLDAYRLYVQGRTELDERTEAGMRQAIEYFRRAIRQDSSYALAWSGLADARTLLASYGHAQADTVLPLAMEAAQRALQLDPELAEAHASLGLLYQDIDRNGPAAVRELRRATELKPSYARAHHWLGILLIVLGRREEATRELERAARLDPTSPSIHSALAGAYRYSDRPEDALTEARRTRELAPSYSLGLWITGMGLSEVGRQQEALAVLRRVFERTNPGPYVAAQTRAWLAIAHRRAGDTARARELLTEIRENGQVPFAAATVYAEMGEWDAAIQALRAAEYDYLRTEDLRYSPLFDPIRDDARFSRILRAVNKQWGLSPDGSFPDSVDVSLGSETDD